MDKQALGTSRKPKVLDCFDPVRVQIDVMWILQAKSSSQLTSGSHLVNASPTSPSKWVLEVSLQLVLELVPCLYLLTFESAKMS